MKEHGIKDLPNIKGGMTYYMDTPRQLPLVEDKISFAVIRQNGLSSNSWRVRTTKAGDVYIACRDHLQDLKISLHKSGRYQVVLDSKKIDGGRHHMHRWDKPMMDGIELASAFQILFPSYALCLNQEIRDSDSQRWGKNLVYIESPENPFGTVVSFFIIDENVKTMNRGDSLAYPLAVLPASEGKRLWVIVNHVHEGLEMNVIWNDYMSRIGDNLDEGAVEKLKGMPDGQVLTLTVSGQTAKGGVYFFPFPIEIRKGKYEA